jgi:poly(A) polymerase/tRNA nucleotidyltransferase (CCA-adding enzyme)
MASPLEPETAMAALRAAGIKVVATGLAHGTVTAIVEGRGFEITTLRRDVATDGRHAVVAFTTDWEQDAARRDFTINAMSMTRDGTVFDYFGGTEDLRAGRVRFVGDAARRVREDYLRVLRFFRFYARYASQAPDAPTKAALVEGIAGLPKLSAERVWHEIRLILAIASAAKSVGLMDRLGIWAAVMPEALAIRRLAALPPDPIVRIAGMITGDPRALATRLKLSNDDRDRLLRILAVPGIPANDDGLRRILADHRKDDVIARAWLDGVAEGVRGRVKAMAPPEFPLEGRDVLAAGLTPGPAVGELLTVLRQQWLASGCTMDRNACLAELARRVEQAKINGKR